jgi:hypothetical protein
MLSRFKTYYWAHYIPGVVDAGDQSSIAMLTSGLCQPEQLVVALRGIKQQYVLSRAGYEDIGRALDNLPVWSGIRMLL